MILPGKAPNEGERIAALRRYGILHAILDAERVLVVIDTLDDARFKGNPLAEGEPLQVRALEALARQLVLQLELRLVLADSATLLEDLLPKSR